jgi:hypothetical protein
MLNKEIFRAKALCLWSFTPADGAIDNEVLMDFSP